MSLNIGKEPVEKPCEAATFEEAYHKNRMRMSDLFIRPPGPRSLFTAHRYYQ